MRRSLDCRHNASATRIVENPMTRPVACRPPSGRDGGETGPVSGLLARLSRQLTSDALLMIIVLLNGRSFGMLPRFRIILSVNA